MSGDHRHVLPLYRIRCCRPSGLSAGRRRNSVASAIGDSTRTPEGRASCATSASSPLDSASDRSGKREDRPTGRSHQWLPAGLRWPRWCVRRITASPASRCTPQESRMGVDYPTGAIVVPFGPGQPQPLPSRPAWLGWLQTANSRVSRRARTTRVPAGQRFSRGQVVPIELTVQPMPNRLRRLHSVALHA